MNVDISSSNAQIVMRNDRVENIDRKLLVPKPRKRFPGDPRIRQLHLESDFITELEQSP